MTKIAVVTDSTASIQKEHREQLNIEMIPLNVIFGEESYEDEIELSIEDFYEKMKNTSELPKTSQPAIGKFVELYERLGKDYDAIISIHLSSGISGTFQAAVSASEMVEGVDIEVFDSEISSLMQGFYAIEAAEMASAGKSFDEIKARMAEMKESMDAYIMVDDLSHLQRGGRLSGAQAFFGSLLQIKPILHIDHKIVPYEKIRTKKKAISKILEIFEEKTKGAEKVKAVVVHGKRPEEAEEIKKRIEADHPNAELYVTDLTPVLATHLGEGTLAVGWYIV
jgi:DegV family protein with EDD domain